MYWLIHSQGELKQEEAASLLHADLPIRFEQEQDCLVSLGSLQGAAGSCFGHTFPPTLKPRFPVLQLGSFSRFFLTFLRSFAVILR